ncbi:MAG: chromate resistance protein ChrB domain-containing protein [Pseudomonadota bacterium]
MPGPTEISPTSLARLIGTPDAPVMFDVCVDADFAEDPRLIPGSRRVAHDALEGALPALSARPVVVICQKGKKLSHGAAALLRSHGHRAETLKGGIEAWRDAGLPLLPAEAMPERPIWVTRQRPRIDRIACPWLLRRFVREDTRILLVPPPDVLAVAERFGATALDAPGAPFADAAGRTTFDALLGHLRLATPALEAMAEVIRAADLGGDHPLAPGLNALSVGLSRMYRDDGAQLEAALPLFDALYRWARDGQAESHGHG